MKGYLVGIITSLALAVYPVPSSQVPDIIRPETAGIGVVSVAKAAEFVPHNVWVTAYSSSPDETDDTPFTTANNTEVHDGVIATNLLPFGTLVKIPDYFGDKVFMVEDRMHRRKTNFVDIWMPSKERAKNFGIHYTEILVLE
jgi:3D (Asp-Asp-Asp) domain-containing protein